MIDDYIELARSGLHIVTEEQKLRSNAILSSINSATSLKSFPLENVKHIRSFERSTNLVFLDEQAYLLLDHSLRDTLKVFALVIEGRIPIHETYHFFIRLTKEYIASEGYSRQAAVFQYAFPVKANDMPTLFSVGKEPFIDTITSVSTDLQEAWVIAHEVAHYEFRTDIDSLFVKASKELIEDAISSRNYFEKCSSKDAKLIRDYLESKSFYSFSHATAADFDLMKDFHIALSEHCLSDEEFIEEVYCDIKASSISFIIGTQFFGDKRLIMRHLAFGLEALRTMSTLKLHMNVAITGNSSSYGKYVAFDPDQAISYTTQKVLLRRFIICKHLSNLFSDCEEELNALFDAFFDGVGDHTKYIFDPYVREFRDVFFPFVYEMFNRKDLF